MNLEQVTFRVILDGSCSDRFIHFIPCGGSSFSVKFDDILMTMDEFESFVKQINFIKSKVALVQDFAKDINA